LLQSQVNRRSIDSPTISLIFVTAAPAVAQSSPDFLFGRPNGMIGMRTGRLFASANSDLFTDVQEQFTLERKDFNAPAIGIDLDLVVTPRTSIVLGFDFSKSSKNSEYRDFVDNDRAAITQTTSLREVIFSGSVKYALTPRGREVSSRAWIPAAITPYVGAGAGLMRYEFLQYGDFIRFTDFSVLPDTLRSNGWAPSAHTFAGVDVKVLKRLYVSGEARYLWARTELDREVYQGFEPIDLAGFKVTAGIHYLF
jgi:hypothetical protein